MLCRVQFQDVRLLHELAGAHHFTQLAIHPPDYCVTGDGLDAHAATSVNECYITGKEVCVHVGVDARDGGGSRDTHRLRNSCGARALCVLRVLCIACVRHG